MLCRLNPLVSFCIIQFSILLKYILYRNWSEIYSGAVVIALTCQTSGMTECELGVKSFWRSLHKFVIRTVHLRPPSACCRHSCSWVAAWAVTLLSCYGFRNFWTFGSVSLKFEGRLLYFIFPANCMNGNNAFPYVVTILGTLLEKDKYSFGFISW